MLSKYTKDEIEKSGVKMRLLKDLNITSLLAEYFSKLKSAKLAVTTQKGILNFLLMISEEKKYRPYIVNKGVIEYLKMMFDNEATKKPMREKIDKVSPQTNPVRSELATQLNSTELKRNLMVLLVFKSIFSQIRGFTIYYIFSWFRELGATSTQCRSPTPSATSSSTSSATE